MLGNKEKDKIVKRYGDYYWEQIKKLSESYDKDLEERAREIEQKDKRIAELEQDLEFTTKTANELIEIKHKLEQELAELKEKLSKATQFETPHIERFALVRYLAQKNKPYKIVNCYDCYRDKEYKIHYCFYNVKSMNFKLIKVFATEQEAQDKLKEIQGNE